MKANNKDESNAAIMWPSAGGNDSSSGGNGYDKGGNIKGHGPDEADESATDLDCMWPS